MLLRAPLRDLYRVEGSLGSRKGSIKGALKGFIRFRVKKSRRVTGLGFYRV